MQFKSKLKSLTFFWQAKYKLKEFILVYICKGIYVGVKIERNKNNLYVLKRVLMLV